MRRNKYDIWGDILALAEKPQKRTWIVYKCNLNFQIVKTYLRELLSKGFLKIISNGRRDIRYQRTDRGSEYVEMFTKVIRD